MWKLHDGSGGHLPDLYHLWEYNWMLLMDFDKAGAEWVIVAYLSGDARMIDIVESGKSPHVETAKVMFGLEGELIEREEKLVGKFTDPDKIADLRRGIPEFQDKEFKPLLPLPRSMSIRQMGKKSNHGCNYREGYRMFALINEIEEREAKPVVEAYSTTVYPGVSMWWQAIDDQLKKDRTFVNCFGRKIRFLDEMGPELKKSATSFLPQSTVVDMVNEAMCLAYEDESATFRPFDLLCQTHDSITGQYPTDDWTLMADFAIRLGLGYLNPEIEYNLRKFTVGTDLKVGLDWEHMVGVKLVPDAQEVSRNLQQAWDKLHERAATT